MWLSGLNINCFMFNDKLEVTFEYSPANTKPQLRRMTNSTEQRIVLIFGNVAEWLKAPVSKTGNGATRSRVRISPFPHKGVI
jgi:hypothetical protein